MASVKRNIGRELAEKWKACLLGEGKTLGLTRAEVELHAVGYAAVVNKAVAGWSDDDQTKILLPLIYTSEDVKILREQVNSALRDWAKSAGLPEELGILL